MFNRAVSTVTRDAVNSYERHLKALFVFCFFSLRGFAVGDGDGFNPAAERNYALRCPGRDFLSLSLPVCLPATAALSRLPAAGASRCSCTTALMRFD